MNFEVLDYLPVGAFVLTPAFEVCFWNRHMEAWSGITREAAVGASIFDHCPQLSQPEYRARLAAVFAGESPVILSSLVARDSIPVTRAGCPALSITVTAVPGDEPGTHYALFSLQDITEHKRWEQALLQRNAELASINQLVQNLSAHLDLAEVITQLLETVTTLLDAEAATVWLWDLTRKDALVCPTLFQHGRPRYPEDLCLLPGQGLTGWVAATGESLLVTDAPADPRFLPELDAQTELLVSTLLAVPLRVQDEVIGVLEVVNKRVGPFTETDRVLLETLSAPAAVAVDNVRLVERLRQQTSELQARNEELDAFAHTVAHDLKTPINLITGYAEVLLEDDYTTMSQSQVNSFLEEIQQGGYKINSIINELMLLARVRMKTVEMSSLAMGAIVAEALQRQMTIILAAQAELSLPDQWPVAIGYAPWVEEVWANYVSNAIKYGGDPPQIALGAMELPEQDAVRFWVRDNGRGFTTEQRDQLFVPFKRLEQDRASGHGLGLSIVRRIVHRLGGEVGVTSEVGRGSTFWFTLPKAVSQ